LLAAGIVLAVIATDSAARADCTPAAADNVTATCSGTTTNQGNGAPGTSADPSGFGYGTGVETGVTVNVVAGSGNTITGSGWGISLGDAMVTNNAGAGVTGGSHGIHAATGFANVTNSGSITGTSGFGIEANTNATVTNNAGGSITGGFFGIYAGGGFANVTNSSSITGTSVVGIAAQNATVTNNASASITGGVYAIFTFGFADVTNLGSITGLNNYGILAGTNATVTNNAGSSITGGQYGISASSGFANVTNSGSITGTSNSGILAATNATVTNNAGGIITGNQVGINGNTGSANVTNSGSITGTTGTGIRALTSATVTNNAGAFITGGLAGIVAGGSVSVTNSGSITGGDYGIRVVGGAGGSSVLNAGSISGGTAAIRFAGVGNTLTLAPGSAITGNVLGTGSDTFQLGGTGSATFDASQLGAAAQYQGFGTFNKIDSSIWTLTGTSTFAGPINVNDGTLIVNGNVASTSGVIVDAAGALAGTGTVGNTLVSGGIFSPGSGTPGSSMTVTGTLGFNGASTYAVNVNPTTSSFANVSGVATLGGATVNSSFAAGSYIAKQYMILNAGSISGTFNPVVTNFNLPANFHDTLSYDATHAYLDLALNFAIPGGLTGNQANVGNALTNFFNSTGGIPMLFAALTPAGLSQAAGETATGSQQTTFNAMTQFMGVMTDPFIAGRGDPIGAGGSPNAYPDSETPSYAAKRKPADALAAIYTKAPLPGRTFEQRWSVWAAGFGGSQTTDGNTVAGSSSTRSSLYGVAAGADYRLSPNALAGFALAGGGTNFSVVNGGSGRSDLFQAGAFIRHNFGPAYLTGALAYGWQDVTTDRAVTVSGIDRLRAQFNANAWSGRLEGGYRFVAQGFGLTPYVAGQFTTFQLPGYAETVVSGANTFALAFAAKDVTASRSELGLRTDKSFAVQDGIFTLRGRAAWAHNFNTDRSALPTFQALPGASFVVNGATQARDAALLTASAEMKWLNGFSVAGTFEGEFSNVTRSFAGKGVVRYAW
jgi:uncharacterized protein with beta-barrel porin domain